MRWPVAVIIGLLLPAAGGAEARDLISHGSLYARTGGKDWCGENAKVFVDAPDQGPFSGDRVALQRLIGGLRAVIGFECPNAAGVLVTGRVEGETVYRGLAGTKTGWALMNLPPGRTEDAPTRTAIKQRRATSDAKRESREHAGPARDSDQEQARSAARVGNATAKNERNAVGRLASAKPVSTALQGLRQARRKAEEDRKELGRTIAKQAAPTGLLGSLASVARQHGFPGVDDTIELKICRRAVDWLSGAQLVYVNLGDSAAPKLVPVLAGAWQNADAVLGRSADRITDSDAKLWRALQRGCRRRLARTSIPPGHPYRQAVFEMAKQGITFGSAWPLSLDPERRQEGVDALRVFRDGAKQAGLQPKE